MHVFGYYYFICVGGIRVRITHGQRNGARVGGKDRCDPY